MGAKRTNGENTGILIQLENVTGTVQIGNTNDDDTSAEANAKTVINGGTGILNLGNGDQYINYYG
ncbi:hypothetical protein ACFC1B_29595 [Streptomyces xiamenensis]|uniref:hypothetical protein n=1 Tax=Streptomyces xiamenensis TaxID=408015 RepID=UPI0035E349E8